MGKRPDKRERMAMAYLGHSHSPPTNSKAIRKANLQRIATGVRYAFSDTPSVIAKASALSPHVKAYAPSRGQGQGKEKPRITPAAKRRFADIAPRFDTVDLVTSKAGQLTKTRVIQRIKPTPQRYVSERERNERSEAGKRFKELPDTAYNRICKQMGIDPKSGRYTAKPGKD